MIQGIAAALIFLAIADWWCVAVLWRIALRHPEIRLFRAELERSLLITAAASAIGVLSANYLLNSPLPRGTGFVLLVTAVLLMSTPSVHFLVTYYRRRP
jgi:hypothetical protein